MNRRRGPELSEQLINFGDGTPRSEEHLDEVLTVGTPKGASPMLEIVDYLKARMNTNERGAAAVEYALLIAFIAAAIVLVVTTLGTKLQDTFTSVTTAI
jgi:pilus assembly protein Flp/PilA